MSKVRELFQKITDFTGHGIWRMRRESLPPGKSFFIALLKILILSLRGFAADKCQYRASALTFYSLISVVPVAAMAFGIAKGFGFEKMLETQLRSRFADYAEVLNKIISFSHSLLESTKGGLIAGVGLIVLFWAVIKVLGNIEDALNGIWKIKERRTIGRKFSDYLSLILVCPVLMILSSSMTIFITTQVTMIMKNISLLETVSPLVFLLLKLLPYCLVWGLFTFLFVVVPNTKVHVTSGLLGGIIAGTIFQILQKGYIIFQVGAAKYNAIYGSFTAFPLFLVWLQLSWLIVLYGAELSFAHQNMDTYEYEPDALPVSHRLRTLLSLQVTHRLITNFIQGEPPLTAPQISHQLEIPLRLVNEILVHLEQSNIISLTETRINGERGFQPARDVNALSIQFIVDALELRGSNTLPLARGPEFHALSSAMDTFRSTLEKLPANRLLKDI